MLTKIIVVIIVEYIRISNHYVEHLKLITYNVIRQLYLNKTEVGGVLASLEKSRRNSFKVLVAQQLSWEPKGKTPGAFSPHWFGVEHFPATLDLFAL